MTRDFSPSSEKYTIGKRFVALSEEALKILLPLA